MNNLNYIIEEDIISRGYFYLDEILENLNLQSIPLRKITSIQLRGIELNLQIPLILNKMDFIKEIDFSRTGFSEEDVSELPLKIRILNLENCTSLEKIPIAINHFNCLLKLNLSSTHVDGNGLKNLPSQITELEVNECPLIVSLPEEFKQLDSLKVLSLSQTMIKGSDLMHLPTSLERINLSQCSKVATLPKSFEKLEELIHLDLSYTAIKEYKTSLCHLPDNISHLNLSYSKIKAEQCSFWHIIYDCQELYLDGTKVETLWLGYNKGKLKVLSLKNCIHLTDDGLLKNLFFNPKEALSIKKIRHAFWDKPSGIFPILMKFKKFQVGRKDRLERLNLEGTNISKQAIKKIKRTYPSLQIL